MNLYERLRELTVRFDTLNLDYEDLNRKLREILIEARIEKDKGSKEYIKFKNFVLHINNTK